MINSADCFTMSTLLHNDPVGVDVADTGGSRTRTGMLPEDQTFQVFLDTLEDHLRLIYNIYE